MSCGKRQSSCDSLFVITNSQLEMPWVDAALLVIAGSIASELKDFCSQILEHSREINYEHVRSLVMKHEIKRDRPGAPLPIRRPRADFLSMRWIRLTGNCSPAL